MDDWLSVTINLPPLAGEALSEIFFAAGAEGLWEDTPDKEGRLVYRAGFPSSRQAGLMAELPAALTRCAEALELSLADFKLSMELTPGQDYSETWKKDLSPIKVSEKLVIAPSWWTEELNWPPNGILRLDPGSAFGSGRHATTFLSLLLLSELALPQRPKKILDVGAGSGILSLAAVLLHPDASVTGVDNDPETISVALNNLKENNLEGRAEFGTNTLDSLNPGYDLILANLTLNPLLELAPEIARLAGETGQLILSGLLDSQVPELLPCYQNLGFALTRHLGRDEWSALLLSKGPEKSKISRKMIPTEATT